MDLLTVLSTVISGFLGGWIGAYLQAKNETKKNTIELLWQYRLKLHEARQMMWIAERYYAFEGSINWLRVGSSDPRINIQSDIIESFAKLLIKGRQDLQESMEQDPVHHGISKDLLSDIDKIQQKIDEIILIKLSSNLKS
jgi:LytS/YehU family sensor histidine kinase